MKINIFIFLLFLNFISFYSQDNCSCEEDIKSSYWAVVTNISVVKKQNIKFLKFQCADLIRIYYSKDGTGGNEIEKEQLHCVSTKIMLLKLSKDFKYHIPEDSNDNRKKNNLEKLYTKIKSKNKNFYRLDFNKRREIELIYDFLLPENE